MSRLNELDAYLTGELDEGAADALEEALFDVPDDEDLAFVDIVARHGRRLVDHGTYDVGAMREDVDRLLAQGKRVCVVDPGPPGTKTLLVASDTEILATRLAFGRTDVERVDVEIYIIDHDITKVIRDVPVDQRDGSVIGLCERPLAELAMQAGPTIAKVRERTGARTVLGEWHLATAFAP